MFGLFLSYCILFVLDHILSYCIRFLDLENAKKLRYCHISGKKTVAILKIKDGGHRVLGKNVNIVFSDSVGPNVSKNV